MIAVASDGQFCVLVELVGSYVAIEQFRVDGNFRVLFWRRGRERGIHEAGDLMGNAFGASVAGVEIGEHHDGEVVVHIA